MLGRSLVFHTNSPGQKCESVVMETAESPWDGCSNCSLVVIVVLRVELVLVVTLVVVNPVRLRSRERLHWLLYRLNQIQLVQTGLKQTEWCAVVSAVSVVRLAFCFHSRSSNGFRFLFFFCVMESESDIILKSGRFFSQNLLTGRRACVGHVTLSCDLKLTPLFKTSLNTFRNKDCSCGHRKLSSNCREWSKQCLKASSGSAGTAWTTRTNVTAQCDHGVVARPLLRLYNRSQSGRFSEGRLFAVVWTEVDSVDSERGVSLAGALS